MVRLIVALALLTFSILFACGPSAVPRKCTAESCKGCCTIEDRCEEGNLKAACGVGGVVCTICNAADFCRNGNCTSDPGCKSLGGSCTAPEQCCVGLTCGSNGTCTGGAGGCKASGLGCIGNTECCSNLCSNNVCQNQCGGLNGSCIPCCQPGLTCINQQCQPGGGGGGGSGSGGGGGAACAPLNGSCSVTFSCCGGYLCQQGICRP